MSVFVAPALLDAQEPGPPAIPAVIPPDSLREGASPGGAFLRSLVIPGWGHLATDSPTRGAFYFGVTGLNSYMLVKSSLRLTSARHMEAMWRDVAEQELIRAGVSDPDSLQTLVDEDERVLQAQSLVESREQQQEDWIAVGIFFLFLSAADAFVSAHLADFPQPLDLEAQPVGTEGRVEVGVRIPWNGPGG
jgi:hypothetical protein